jgi:serine/threonine protein kinase
MEKLSISWLKFNLIQTAPFWYVQAGSISLLGVECHCSQMIDVAHGLRYLHHEKIVHGDLKGVNYPQSNLAAFMS